MLTEKGFTLVEMLIALAISAIIIGAAFGSYTIIARNFEWQADMKYISQSARSVVEMMTKDIRNAGFRFESSAAITDPVKIYDAGDAKDRIEIIYDETETPYKRVKIEYRLQQYSNDNSRFRLFKKKTNMTSGAIEYDSPIADYIEALQFTGSNGDCAQGDKKYGCGNDGWLTPISITASDPWGVGSHPNPEYANDNNPSTVFVCSTPFGANCFLVFEFAEYFRLKKFKSHVAAGINGGSIGTYNFNTRSGILNWPFAAAGGNTNLIPHPLPYYPLSQSIEVLVDGNNCSWSSDCTPINRAGFTNIGPENVGEAFTLFAPECDYDYINQQDNSCEKTLDTAPRSLPPGISISNPIQQSIINRIIVAMTGNQSRCGAFSAAHSGHSIPQMHYVANCGFGAIPEIKFYGEIFGGEINAREVKVGLIFRSPSEHGSVNRNYSKTIVDFAFSKNDKYLRDTYVTSATIRNIYYQSQ